MRIRVDGVRARPRATSSAAARARPLGELGARGKAAREGVIGAVGAGMNHAAPLRRIVRETDVDRVLLAGRYTLLDRSGLMRCSTSASSAACP